MRKLTPLRALLLVSTFLCLSLSHPPLRTWNGSQGLRHGREEFYNEPYSSAIWILLVEIVLKMLCGDDKSILEADRGESFTDHTDCLWILFFKMTKWINSILPQITIIKHVLDYIMFLKWREDFLWLSIVPFCVPNKLVIESMSHLKWKSKPTWLYMTLLLVLRNLNLMFGPTIHYVFRQKFNITLRIV